MEEFIEMAFGNRFFELPFLEALSYIVAVLMVGAIIVGLTRRALNLGTPSTETTYAEPSSDRDDTWEWRKAA
ncbi:MAG TPA: hypothetical protein VFR79_08775 [Nitrospira sp.]|nr:hypothetical protein [Nitrospira sp.]